MEATEVTSCARDEHLGSLRPQAMSKLYMEGYLALGYDLVQCLLDGSRSATAYERGVLLAALFSNLEHMLPSVG